MTKYVPDEIAVLTTSGSYHYFETSINEIADGGWIVTWLEHDGDYGNLYMQRYDAAGGAVGEPDNLGHIGSQIVTALADGGWLIEGWDLTTIPGVEAVWRFDAAGRRVEMANPLDAGFEGIAGLPDGGWLGIGLVDVGDREELVQQRYSGDGQPVGSGLVLSSSLPGYTRFGDVVLLEDGGWLITWGNSSEWFQQRFANDGTAMGEATVVASHYFLPRTAALEDGGWVTFIGTSVQRYDADGHKVGEAVTIGDAEDGPYPIAIEGLSGGGWAVAWGQRTDSLPWHSATLLQVFAADGTATGRPYEVLNYGIYDATIQALDSGAFVVKWEWGDTQYSHLKQRVFQPAASNAAPVASDDAATMIEGRKISIDVLDNDIDSDAGDLLTIESAHVVQGNASVAISEDGHLLVRDMSSLLKGQTATLVVEYTVSDGFETDTGLVSVQVSGKPADGDEISGTQDADQLRGSKFDEIFFGLGGHDLITSKGGDDILVGGAGDDHIKGGTGRDLINGGKGDDIMDGGSGSDTFVFRPGDGRDIVRILEWGLGDREIIDLTAFNFRSIDEVRKLAEADGYDLIIDLKGRDRIEIINGLDDAPLFFSI